MAEQVTSVLLWLLRASRRSHLSLICTWANTHPPAPHNHIHTRESVSVGSVSQVMLTDTKDQYTCLGVELFVVEMGILLRKSKAL